MSRCIQTVSQDAVAASQQCILVQQTEQAPMSSAVSFDALQQQAVAEGLLDTLQPLPREEIRAAQQQDPVIGKMYSYIKQNRKPTAHKLQSEGPQLKALVREWSKLEIREGLWLEKQNSKTNWFFLQCNTLLS